MNRQIKKSLWLIMYPDDGSVTSVS